MPSTGRYLYTAILLMSLPTLAQQTPASRPEADRIPLGTFHIDAVPPIRLHGQTAVPGGRITFTLYAQKQADGALEYHATDIKADNPADFQVLVNDVFWATPLNPPVNVLAPGSFISTHIGHKSRPDTTLVSLYFEQKTDGKTGEVSLVVQASIGAEGVHQLLDIQQLFLGNDQQGNPRFGEQRATVNKTFRGELNGGEKSSPVKISLPQAAMPPPAFNATGNPDPPPADIGIDKAILWSSTKPAASEPAK